MIQLNNEEICLLYFQSKAILETVEFNLDKNRIYMKVDIEQLPGIQAKQPISITQEDILVFKNGDYYKTLVSVVNKLKPFAELIVEADPSLVEKRIA